jgi:hypothetical protein
MSVRHSHQPMVLIRHQDFVVNAVRAGDPIGYQAASAIG